MQIRTILFTLCLLAPNLLAAQSNRFFVFIDDYLVGNYSTSEENGAQIDTFFSLRFSLVQFGDSVSFSSETRYTEDTLGKLASVSYRSVFQGDSIDWIASFSDDSVTIMSLTDTAYRRVPPIIFGPSKIRNLCKTNLDSIGRSVCYLTYIPELKKVMEVERTVMSASIERAQKLWVVEEKISGLFATTSKFNSDFDLVEKTDNSPFGRIKIIQSQKSNRPLSMLARDFYASFPILSNIRFPDPLNIAKTKLRITIDGNTERLVTLSAESKNITLSEKETFKYLESNRWIHWDSLIQEMADSITLLSQTDLELFGALSQYITDKRKKPLSAIRHPAIEFAAVARACNIPTKIAFGYVYQNGFWLPRFINEVWIEDQWRLYDPGQNVPINPAIFIKPIAQKTDQSFDEYLLQINQVLGKISIRCQEYQYKNRNYSIDQSDLNQARFDGKKYHNKGLGLKFELLEAFSLSQLPTMSNSTFATFTHPSGTKIVFEQVVIGRITQLRQSINRTIFDRTEIPEGNIRESPKTGFFLGESASNGAIAIPQGSSFVLITITADEPRKLINYLLKKNLKIDY